jgi:hypothetical protein
MTAAAGARRGASAIDRLVEANHAATVQVLPNEPGFDWDVVRSLPGVEAVGEVVFSRFELDGRGIEAPVFADTESLYRLERPVVLDGRLARPDRPDEVAVTPVFLDSFGKGVGDSMTLRLYRPETLQRMTADWRNPAEVGELTRADGPALEVRIVGVVRSFLLTESLGDEGWLVPSAGLFAEYPSNLLGPPGTGSTSAIVRLAGGIDGVAAFQSALTAATGRTDISIWNLAESAVFDKNIVSIEATSLAVFGLAAGVAAGDLTLRYLKRELRAESDPDQDALFEYRADAGGAAQAAIDRS